MYPMNENASNSAGSKGNSRRRLVRNNAVSVSENNKFYCTEKNLTSVIYYFENEKHQFKNVFHLPSSLKKTARNLNTNAPQTAA